MRPDADAKSLIASPLGSAPAEIGQRQGLPFLP
jgi:hypothetical protein